MAKDFSKLGRLQKGALGKARDERWSVRKLSCSRSLLRWLNFGGSKNPPWAVKWKIWFFGVVLWLRLRSPLPNPVFGLLLETLTWLKSFEAADKRFHRPFLYFPFSSVTWPRYFHSCEITRGELFLTSTNASGAGLFSVVPSDPARIWNQRNASFLHWIFSCFSYFRPLFHSHFFTSIFRFSWSTFWDLIGMESSREMKERERKREKKRAKKRTLVLKILRFYVLM